MEAIVTVGLGFGDEGKGATVDFLTRQHNAEWVVRYSGGAQAGHNVQLPDGHRHTFSQFGAGTLAGAKTFLGPRVVICPQTLNPEAGHLVELGIEDPIATLTAHPDCLLSSTYHMSMNRLRELDRGKRRHGSCGLGIGETRSDWLKHGLDAATFADVGDRPRLVNKLRLLRDRMLLAMQSLDRVDHQIGQSIYRTPPEFVADSIIEEMQGVGIAESLPKTDVLIFEGAQGVLLDEYFGFHPYTTWSTVTTLHARELLAQAGVSDVCTLGITRAYSTRHGAGPFPTACPKMTQRMCDVGNPENDWQGGIQFGPLDMVLLRYAAATENLDGIVVNHLDELTSPSAICRRYQNADHLGLPQSMSDQEALTRQLDDATPEIDQVRKADVLAEIGTVTPVVISGAGPTYLDREFMRPLRRDGSGRNRSAAGIITDSSKVEILPVLADNP